MIVLSQFEFGWLCGLLGASLIFNIARVLRWIWENFGP